MRMHSACDDLAAGLPHSDVPRSRPGYRLPWAYRRFPRPSSPSDAKTFTTCPLSLDHINPTPTTPVAAFGPTIPLSLAPGILTPRSRRVRLREHEHTRFLPSNLRSYPVVKELSTIGHPPVRRTGSRFPRSAMPLSGPHRTGRGNIPKTTSECQGFVFSLFQAPTPDGEMWMFRG